VKGIQLNSPLVDRRGGGGVVSFWLVDMQGDKAEGRDKNAKKRG